METPALHSVAERAAAVTPPALARHVRGLSDRALAWLFIAPTILLLLAINIFPLLWTIKLSFTNYRANRPNAPLADVGIDHYVSILTDPDVWTAMQATAHFLFWTIALQTLLGFGLAYLIDRKFRGHGFWTTVILIPMMLSPAVVGNFWAFLYQPQIGLWNYAVAFLTGVPASSFTMIGSVQLAPSSTPGCGHRT
jgi:multiple sugar transport system permease protein